MAEMILTEKKKQAIELNEQIIFKAQLAQKNLYDMCVMLKQMRDDKLYKELGYANFEDYCENEVGMKWRNAYNYISIVEKIPSQNLQSIAKIGMTKLSLLASLSEVQQEEIQQNVNLEETSVRELKAEIAKLKDDNDKIRSAKISMESDLLNVKSNNRSLRHQLDDAEKKIADLESRPVEVAIQEDEEGKIAKALVKQLDRQLSEADQNHVNEVQKIRREYQNQINELEEQLTEMTEQAEHKEIIEKVDNTAVFDVYFKMVDKIIYSIQAHIANDIDVGNKMIYNHQINELIRRLEKCLKQ